MIFFWPKVYGPLGKTPYIYPRYQVWGVTDLNFDLAYYHPPPTTTVSNFDTKSQGGLHLQHRTQVQGVGM